MKRLSLRLDDGLAAAIDEARAGVPWQVWVRVACELRLAGGDVLGAREREVRRRLVMGYPESRENGPEASPEPVSDVSESRAMVSPSRPESRVEAFRRVTQR